MPPETNELPSSRMKAGGSSQKEMLFIRGKAMSGAPIMIGTNQLPKPPIIAGMTMKKTMIRPWALTSTFHMWWASSTVASGMPRKRWKALAQVPRYCRPGSASSARIRPEIVPPMMPAVTAKIR